MPETFNPNDYLEGGKKALIDNNYAGLKGLDAEKVKKIAIARIEARNRESKEKEIENASMLSLITNAFSPDTKSYPIPKAGEITTKEFELAPKEKMENLIPKQEAERIARETNTTLFETNNRPELIKTMYKMNLVEGGTDLNNKNMNDAIISYGGERGVSGAHYSYETFVKAANHDQSTHTQEFNKLINQLVAEGKITKNNNGTISEKVKGGGIILSLNNGDPAFLVHEGRHAEAAYYDLRNNPEALSKAEEIIQNQSIEWKKKALITFLGSPYWEGLSEPTGLVKWDTKVDKGTYADEYLRASSGKILINPQKRAWMIDEFVAYASDRNDRDIPDIPAMKDFAKKNQKKKQ